MKLPRLLLLTSLLLAPLLAPADEPVAPKPLFRDPVYDGAADPVVIWNPQVQRWWMFYTNRRANVLGLSGVAWVHGTPIGIAESADGGVTWKTVGNASIDLPAELGGTTPTLWAPDVITAPDGTHHMFLTVVPGVFEDWKHPRTIVHLTSTDLRTWVNPQQLKLGSDRVIDAAVHPLPGGGWRMWYNNERDHKSIYYADSPDLTTWTDQGKCTGVGEHAGEGPYVFQWKGAYWMLVDLWKGLGVYRSDDLLHWTAQADNLLGVPGTGVDDGVNGGHPGVVVSDDRAYLFYFTHPGRAGTIAPEDKGSLELRRSSIQVTELVEKDGRLECDRNKPVAIKLTPPRAAEEIANPLIPQRADPFVTRHTDGYYYFMGTVPEYDRLELRRATTIAGLATTEGKTIWRKHEAGEMGAHIWAPEIHFIAGKWYIYFAAGREDKIWDIRIYVLENTSANPLEGEWIERGQLKTNWESFALDSTTFEHRGIRYLVWAQYDPTAAKGTNIYIAQMDSPVSITGKQILLTKPEYDWEKVRYPVNEGPALLKKNGRLFLSYSAAGTGAEYCLGLLTADENADPLDPKSWTKSPQPVFTTNEANRIYGPGHNSFTTTPDGKTDLLVYHARNYRDIPGDPLRDPNRNARVQPIAWRADGTPDFGVPRPETPPAWAKPRPYGPVARSALRARDGCAYPDPATQSYILYFASRGPNGRAAVAAYTSKDLETWTGPTYVFERPEEWWADRGIWAPEMHAYKGKYYLFLTFDSTHPFPEQWRDWLPRVKRGSQILVADSPMGPFKPFANKPTLPEDMMTLDGTLYVEDGVPYMVFCHEWVQIKDGTVEMVRLTNDLAATVGEPKRLFHGSDAPWSKKSEQYGCHVTDGPWLYRTKGGKLLMLWSSGSKSGYAVGIATSDSGKLAGPWKQADTPLFAADGGHPMLFRRFDGQLMLALHQPNKTPHEREVFIELEEINDTLVLKGK